jgi:hypothetical protein
MDVVRLLSQGLDGREGPEYDGIANGTLCLSPDGRW